VTISGSAVSPAMDGLVSKCQVLAGRFLDEPPNDLLDGIARADADVPLAEVADKSALRFQRASGREGLCL
jgi:hypothetical protein